MYSRTEAAQLKHEFWIAFGRYMVLHPNSEGSTVNWINYKTGFKHVHIKMDADQKKAVISIQLTHSDELLRELYFDKFAGFRSIMHDVFNEEWIWEKDVIDEHEKMISKIYKEIHGVNVFDKNTWPEIISFLKPRIIALDEVWNNISPAFEDLR